MVRIFNKIVFQGVFAMQGNHVRTFSKHVGKGKLDDTVAVGGVGVVYGIAIAVQETVLAVNHPLQGISEVVGGVFIVNDPHLPGSLKAREYPFHPYLIFQSVQGAPLGP